MPQTPPSPAPTVAQPDLPSRVLIVRPTALGDVSRTVPALVTLRRAMPQAQIDWLVHEAFADVIRHHPDLDNVIPFPRRRFGALWHNPRVTAEAWAWARGLRTRRYDAVFDLQGLFRSGLFTWLTAAPRRVGFANARELAWLGYNRRHPVDPKRHSVDRMLALLEAEGYKTAHNTHLYVGEADRCWLEHWLQTNGGPGPYACIAPTARWRCKCWPIENYIQIARRLLETRLAGDRVVILAAPNERLQVQPLLDALGPSPSVRFPTTTVGQMMALLSKTTLLVCNDSAPLHIAVGFDRPIVTVFGPTDPALVGPYRRDDCVICPPGHIYIGTMDYRHRRDDQSLIAQISIESVWNKILQQHKYP